MRNLLTMLLFTANVLVCLGHADETSDSPREALYHESLRPQFHFTARYWDDYRLNPQNHQEGWLNDLNGLVYHDDQYHLFAQRWWSAWLHAVSTDLVHWKELRPAFGKGGKFGGTQSGGGVVDLHNSSGLGDGQEPPMVAFWSSTDNESQCISYSLDKGLTWRKYAKNPVLFHKYRDPKVFWYEPDQKWIMVLYGPSDKADVRYRYGFNGEQNDAHDLQDFKAGQWMCSAVRMFEDGKVVVNDQQGQSQGQIDINRQQVGTDIFCIGAKVNGSEFFCGDIAEILVYDRTLSDDEVKQVLGQLQTKWGLDKSRQKSAVRGDVLVLHLDASTARANSKGQLTEWKDLTGSGFDAAAQAGKKPQYLPKGLGGRPVIHFDGTQLLQGPAVLSEGDDSFTMIGLWRRDDSTGSQVVFEQNTEQLQPGRRASLLTVCHQEAENVYLLFSSTNLLDWEKLDSSIPDSFECPDMFELPIEGRPNERKWVVIDGNGDYVIGRFDGKRFDAETKKGRGDYGRNFYATMTFQNMPASDQRRIQLAWMRGWDDYPKNMPFNQQVSFPCELTLRRSPGGIVLCRYPVDEIHSIYDEEFALENYILKPGANPLSGLEGELFDINMVIDISGLTCSEIVLNLRGNEVRYDIKNMLLSSVGSQVTLVPKNGLVDIRVLVDRLSIETFGNGGEVSITNIAYQQGTNPHLTLHAVGGQAKIVSLKAYKLKSVWK